MRSPPRPDSLARMNHSTLDTHDRDAPIFARGSLPARRRGSRADRQGAPLRRARAGAARRAARPRRDLPDREFPRHAPRRAAAHLRAEGAWRARRLVPHLLSRRRRARPLLRRDRALLEHACVLHAVDRRARRRSGDERGGARRAQCGARHALPPHRRERRDLFAAVLRRRRGGRGRGGVRHRGEAGRRRLHRQRQEDLRLALGRGRLLRHPLHRARRGRRREPPQHALSRGPGERAGRQRRRRLGSARHARHGLAHAADEGRVRAGERAADAARRLLPRRDLVAAHVPHAIADLHGSRAGGLRLHRRVSARRSARHAAGEAAHVSRPSRSRSPRCA